MTIMMTTVFALLIVVTIGALLNLMRQIGDVKFTDHRRYLIPAVVDVVVATFGTTALIILTYIIGHITWNMYQ